MARVFIILMAIGLLAATFAEASKKAAEKKEETAEAEKAPEEENAQEDANESENKSDAEAEGANADADAQNKEQPSAQAEQAAPAAEQPEAATQNADADAEAESKEGQEQEADQEGQEQENVKAAAKADKDEDKDDDEADKGLSSEDAEKEIKKDDKKKKFECNLKFSKVGCFKDKAKKQRPLGNYIMRDVKMSGLQKKSATSKSSIFDNTLSDFACRCANEALDRGNAVFGIQNIAECWSGADDSKYDKDGKSEECVTFGMEQCSNKDELCAGQKSTNFVYYIDVPDHTKSKEEAKKEMEQLKKAEEEKKKQLAKAKKAKKNKKKQSKKVKTEKKSKKHGKKHAQDLALRQITSTRRKSIALQKNMKNFPPTEIETVSMR